jgi:hypothetical protein
MPNDPTPSPAADRDLPTSHPTDSSPIADAPSPAPQQNVQTPAQKRAHAQTKKKYEFVNGLMTHLDVLIYAELCVVYYMEYARSLLHHLIRGTMLT